MDDLNLDKPLNQAHRYARLAESYENTKNFAEAIKSHQIALEYLQDALSLCTFPKVIESINSQLKYHSRQQNILGLKQAQYLGRQRVLIYKQKQMATLQNEVNFKDECDQNLQWAIYKNVDAVESLIETLLLKRSGEMSPSDKSRNLKRKLSKSDSFVVEELQTLNNHLRDLVSKLVSRLDEKQREIDILKEKLKTNNEGNDKSFANAGSLSSSNESIGTIP